MGRRKYKARLSTAGGPYVFSSCRWPPPPTMSSPLYSSTIAYHPGPPALKLSRRLRAEHKCNQCGEKCACTANLKQHMDVKRDKTSDLCVISSMVAWLEMCHRPPAPTLSRRLSVRPFWSSRWRSEAQPSSRLSFLRHRLIEP